MYFEFDDNENEIIEEGLIKNAIDSIRTYRSIKDLQDGVAKAQAGRIISSNSEDGEELLNTGSEFMNAIKSKIIIDEDYITIKGINFIKFFGRIKEFYSENNFSKIFMMVYTNKSQKLWKKGKIRKKDMAVKYLRFPVFFSLEIAMILEDLGTYYGVGHYKKMARQIRKKTWVKSLHLPVKQVGINLERLNNIRYTLKPYQKEFIEMYPTLKERFNLNGYLLSFDQGLGKTLTAISLAECLNSQQVVIVCPNSLKENWSYEIKEYFYKYEDERLWKDEVFVHGSPKYKFTNRTKYIIVNLEAIPAIYQYVSSSKSSILIVDEMHNVRNMNGKRTIELIDLKKKMGKTDVLLMSGTPIKALPNEIIPSLMLIDPLFTNEVADLYNKCFNVDGVGTKNIVNARFGMVMHRKTKKEVLQLPEKRMHTMYLKVPGSDRYLSDVVKVDVNAAFQLLYNAELKRSEELRLNYINIIDKYHRAPRTEYEEYLKYLQHPYEDYNEAYIERMNNFIDKYVLPNILYPPDLANFKEARTAYLRMRERATGKALGQVMHPRRKEMFIKLYEANKKEVIDMIHNATKKTVIFSTLLEVVDYISKDLTANGVRNVKIVGGSGDRMKLIQEFKNNDDIEVLIATSQTLSTGVTLTEANQMFFFGTPWRSADYNQCCDRIYRIGQNTAVDIYNVLLDTGNELNLSTRMNDILNWSDNMFTSMIDGEDINNR